MKKDLDGHLKKFVKEDFKITSCKMTRWHEDPNSLGSYSFCKINQEQKEWSEELRSPINGKIWMVGEYLHPTVYGCAHSAYETGVWAAEEVIEALKSSDN